MSPPPSVYNEAPQLAAKRKNIIIPPNPNVYSVHFYEGVLDDVSAIFFFKMNKCLHVCLSTMCIRYA